MKVIGSGTVAYTKQEVQTLREVKEVMAEEAEKKRKRS